jgi:hypothetical protein
MQSPTQRLPKVPFSDVWLPESEVFLRGGIAAVKPNRLLAHIHARLQKSRERSYETRRRDCASTR